MPNLMNNDPILATYINTDKTALIEVTYDSYPELPIDNDDLPYRIYIKDLNTKDPNQDIVDELFNGDFDRYMAFHDRFHNSAELFCHLDKIAAPQNKTVTPITKYEHSNVRYYLGVDHGWDMSTIGFAIIDSTNSAKVGHLSVDIEKNLDRITDYANGDVYSVNEYSLNPSHHTKEDIIDSCDSIYACQTTADIIDQHIEDTSDNVVASSPNDDHDFDYQNIHDVVTTLAEQLKNWHPAKTVTTVSYDYESLKQA